MLPFNFTFEFEELPLRIDADGFEAALIAGSAEIAYGRDCDWNIEAINLDAHKREDNAWKRKPVSLERSSPLYTLITTALEGPWRERVLDAVHEQIDEARACRDGDEADRRYDERKMARA